ncbi:ribonuclease H-like domain-containing protein [Sporodiniella umbellata]|nr:ribonuclease H-like domain-containing protein [Sporodiniella umbellata]
MNPPKNAHIISYTEVTANNINEVSSIFLKKVGESSYVAVDLEFTGLSDVNPKDMNHRYVAYKKTVETHAMVSMGLSVVKQTSPQVYVCDNFQFLTLKQGSMTLDTQTGHFLLKHHFSFDRLFQEGLAFWPPWHGASYSSPLNELFKGFMKLLKRQSIPLVTHNGLYDLLYIYHSFIGELPKSLTGFLNDFSNRFPSGMYDTKILVKEQEDQPASFLSYVFSRLDRLRQKRYTSTTSDKPYFEFNVQEPLITTNEKKRTREKEEETSKKKHKGLDENGVFCVQYAERGYCDYGHDIDSQYHNIETILDHQLGPSPCPVSITQPTILKKEPSAGGAHTSQFDAYMTAFTFCYMLHTLSEETLEDLRNKVNIGRQDVPLVFPTSKDGRPPAQIKPIWTQTSTESENTSATSRNENKDIL